MVFGYYYFFKETTIKTRPIEDQLDEQSVVIFVMVMESDYQKCHIDNTTVSDQLDEQSLNICDGLDLH